MWIENLYRPAEILVREHERFPIGEHTHSFYELAYIVSGSGSFSMPEGYRDSGAATSPTGQARSSSFRPKGCTASRSARAADIYSSGLRAVM